MPSPARGGEVEQAMARLERYSPWPYLQYQADLNVVAQALAERNEDTLAAAQLFWAAILNEFWDTDGAAELDYDIFTTVALRCGLLAEVIYDPEQHGEAPCDAEPGDTIYWPTERAMRLRALLPPTTEA